MSATDLRFSQHQPVTTDLRFGLAPGSPGSYNTATIAASVTVGTSAVLTAQTGYLATLAAAVDVGLQAHLTATYDNSVNRHPHAWDGSAWEEAAAHKIDTGARHEVAPKREHNAPINILPGEDRRADLAAKWEWMSKAIRPAANIAWAEAADLSSAFSDGYRDLLRHNRPAVVAPWLEGTRRSIDAVDAWIDLFRRPRPEMKLRWSEAERAAFTLTPAYGAGRAIRRDTRVPWGEGRHPPPGTSAVIVVGPPVHVPCYNPLPGAPVVLLFKDLQPASLDLLFRCPNQTPPGPVGTIVIPVRRAYIVVNELYLRRVDDNTQIPAINLSIQFDCDSWLPSFSAAIPESARDVVMPDPSPVEIYAHINGAEFRFFVEKVTRNRQFAKSSATISGRGIACELDAPFAVAGQHTNIYSMNAQQIIDSALGFTGYTQSWNIDDWVVPSGAFSLFGTPAAVAAHVAEAAGAVLAADWRDKELRMLPRYPVLPWEWAAATPDIVIPSAVTQTESIEWVEKPAYNVVFVAGVQSGIIGNVKRYGTAGDLPAPMVTHPLLTSSEPARAKGGAILADTGRKAMMQISLPILPATGVIDVCRLVEFSDGANTRRGIVRANQITANWPTVRQTLTIEAAA